LLSINFVVYFIERRECPAWAINSPKDRAWQVQSPPKSPASPAGLFFFFGQRTEGFPSLVVAGKRVLVQVQKS
jgi:hypothetical protein